MRAPKPRTRASRRPGSHQRMRAGWGHMVTPEEIDKHWKGAPGASYFLQGIIGIKVQDGQSAGSGRGRGGSMCAVAARSSSAKRR